jgi:hypothetical protein
MAPKSNASPVTLTTGHVALGGLLVTCLQFDPRFIGLNPAEDNGLLRAIKIRSTISSEGN